jgi:hypothetical protein
MEAIVAQRRNGDRGRTSRTFVIDSDPVGRHDPGAMTKRCHTFLLVSLVAAFLAVGVFAVVHAQEGKAPAAKPTKWSDAATWPDRKVPAAGDKVTIAAGKEVILDVSPPALGSLSIDGTLSFADNKDLELTTEWILLHGELEIGTEAKPHTRKATITFTNNVKDEDIGGMGGATDKSDRGNRDHGRNPEPAR